MLCRQAREATCPLCNRLIKLQVQYRLPFPRQLPQEALEEPADVGNLGDLGLGIDAGRDLQVAHNLLCCLNFGSVKYE